jgi:hypothetical protein
MKGLRLALVMVVGMVSAAMAETNWQLQAVDGAGHATYEKIVGMEKVVVEGIVLNNPEDMLNGTYNAPGWMGAQWQIFVQGVDGDHAGTAVWMGQKYGNMGDVNYTEAEWAAEMARVNFDGGYQLRMGDLVRVTGYTLDYNGKTNINERHSSSPLMDFTVEHLGNPGLPSSELISFDMIKDTGDNDIFDSSRLSGGEYFQGQLVRINGVSFVEPSLWAPGATMTITDGERTLPVKLGLDADFYLPSNLDETFDIVGIFNQEGGYTSGYQLWVTQYEGGSDILGVVPEPISMMIMLMGGGMLMLRRRK